MKTLFVTGGAGYVGAMVCDQLARRNDVLRVVALDTEPMPELLAGNEKIVWVRANTAQQEVWWNEVAQYQPDIVIHTAWHIRELYGKRALLWRWNVDGSCRVFEFAFRVPSVSRLVYFSTASLYGAYATNTLDYYFTEDDPMREEEYSYGVEKKRAEELLYEMYADAKKKKLHRPIVSVVRPAAITGPRGRFARVRFGLQSALMGQLSGNVFYKLVSLMVSYVPATPWWVRQYIHEDDVTDVVSLLALDEKIAHEYEVFNITPPGEPVFAPQMAQAAGKRILPVRPWMVRLAFFIFWHLSRGKIPNGRGVWRFYSYPILMDGSKITRRYGYQYRYTPRDAFYYTDGRYAHVVPAHMRREKTL